MAGDSTAGRRDGGGRENDGMQEAEGEGWREKDATSISTHNPMIRLHTKSFSPHNNDLNEILHRLIHNQPIPIIKPIPYSGNESLNFHSTTVISCNITFTRRVGGQGEIPITAPWDDTYGWGRGEGDVGTVLGDGDHDLEKRGWREA
jgi:hypothetical protein